MTIEKQLELTLNAVRKLDPDSDEYVEVLSRLNDRLTEFLYDLPTDWS